MYVYILFNFCLRLEMNFNNIFNIFILKINNIVLLLYNIVITTLLVNIPLQ